MLQVYHTSHHHNELAIFYRSILGTNKDPFIGHNLLLVLVKRHRNAVMIVFYDNNMMLEASSIALASCWIYRLKEKIEIED